MKEASNSRLLAVWWYANGKFFGPCETLDGPHAVTYGRYIQLDIDHFQVWDEYNPLGIGHEYDELPRGRVVFDSLIHKFLVIGPKSLVEEPSFQAEIKGEYGLPSVTMFSSDEHYD